LANTANSMAKTARNEELFRESLMGRTQTDLAHRPRTRLPGNLVGVRTTPPWVDPPASHPLARGGWGPGHPHTRTAVGERPAR
jgi:hypothetical protein